MSRQPAERERWTEEIMHSLHLASSTGASIVAAFETLEHIFLAPDETRYLDHLLAFLAGKRYRTDNFATKFREMLRRVGDDSPVKKFKETVSGLLSFGLEWLKIGHEQRWANYSRETVLAATRFNDSLHELYEEVYKVLKDQTHPTRGALHGTTAEIPLDEILNQHNPLLYLCLSISLTTRQHVSLDTHVIAKLVRSRHGISQMRTFCQPGHGPPAREAAKAIISHAFSRNEVDSLVNLEKMAYAGYVVLLDLESKHRTLPPAATTFSFIFRMTRQAEELEKLKDSLSHVMTDPGLSSWTAVNNNNWRRTNAAIVAFHLYLLGRPIHSAATHGHGPELGHDEQQISHDWLVLCHSLSQRPVRELKRWAKGSQDHLLFYYDQHHDVHDGAPEVPDLISPGSSGSSRPSSSGSSYALSRRKARLFYGIDRDEFTRKWA
ncbi:hypothetical protein ACM66B_003932 [Microbotryomycetes sp. NB124-2]